VGFNDGPNQAQPQAQTTLGSAAVAAVEPIPDLVDFLHRQSGQVDQIEFFQVGLETFAGDLLAVNIIGSHPPYKGDAFGTRPHSKGGIQNAGGVVPHDGSGDRAGRWGVFQILGVVFAHLVGHNGRVGENIDPFPQKKLDGCRVDRNDSVDLYACIFAAQVIGKCMGIGGTAEPSNIQVLIIQLDVEQRVRTEGRADPLWSVKL
jgi:hypothetical protein